VIVAVGSAEDVKPFQGPKTHVLEASSGLAVPGLIDAHGHIQALGATVDELELRGVSSPEEVAQRVAERIKARPGDSWILGRKGVACQDRAVAGGMTGVPDAGVGPVDMEIYRERDRDHKLKLRVYGMAQPPDGKEVEFASRSPRRARPGERFELRAIKLFMDG